MVTNNYNSAKSVFYPFVYYVFYRQYFRYFIECDA